MPDRVAVRETYDRIADHFAETRPRPWREVVEFLDGRTGTVGADIGVGNGRHAEVLAARVERVLGLDLSRAALGTARERASDRGFELALLQADAAALPIRTDTVDLAVYIATLHHLPSRPLRRRSLDELARVLADGGAALVSAWSTSHDRFDRETSFDTTVAWTLPDGRTVPRYYHIYALEDFEADVRASALRLERAFPASGNCYAVVTAPEG